MIAFTDEQAADMRQRIVSTVDEALALFPASNRREIAALVAAAAARLGADPPAYGVHFGPDLIDEVDAWIRRQILSDLWRKYGDPVLNRQAVN